MHAEYVAFTATTSEQKWPSSSLQCGQFGWNAAFSQPFIAVDGSKLLLPDELMRVGGGVPAPSRTASPLLLLKQAGGEVKEGAEEGAGTRRYAAKLLPDGLSDAGAVELAIGAAMAGAAQGAA